MASRRRSSVGGFHKIIVQKAKFKDYGIDIIDYRKLKEEPLSEGEDFKEENKNKTQTTKSQENILNTENTERIFKNDPLKYETNFGMSDAKTICGDDVLKDFTSDVPYESNFEDAPVSKDEGDKKKQVKKFSAKFLLREEREKSQPHSKSSKSKLREEPFKCDVSKNKKSERGHKQNIIKKCLSSGINEVSSINAESKNNLLLEHLGGKPVEEGACIDKFKSGSIKRNIIIKSKTKKDDKNSGSKANLHMLKTVTKAPKFETKYEKDKQDNKSKKFHKELKNGDSAECGNLRQETTMPQRLQNVRRSKRLASLPKVCYKEIFLFKGK